MYDPDVFGQGIPERLHIEAMQDTKGHDVGK
jgi:hypothetical protein